MVPSRRDTRFGETAAPEAKVRRGAKPPRFNDRRLPSPVATAAAVLRSLGEGGANRTRRALASWRWPDPVGRGVPTAPPQVGSMPRGEAEPRSGRYEGCGLLTASRCQVPRVLPRSIPVLSRSSADLLRCFPVLPRSSGEVPRSDPKVPRSVSVLPRFAAMLGFAFPCAMGVFIPVAPVGFC